MNIFKSVFVYVLLTYVFIQKTKEIEKLLQIYIFKLNVLFSGLFLKNLFVALRDIANK